MNLETIEFNLKDLELLEEVIDDFISFYEAQIDVKPSLFRQFKRLIVLQNLK